MNFNQGWVVLLLLGASALSWVFGKMKEKAEAEEARKRAQLHQQRVQRLSEDGADTEAEAGGRVPIEQLATQRKQQLAQLRQERLAALRAEMASRLQTSAPPRPTAPKRQPAPAQRPAPPRSVARPPMPSAAPQPARASVATMRQPPSASRDLAPLVNLGTRREHVEPQTRDHGVHRLVADAETTSVIGADSGAHEFSNLPASEWRKAIILSELLAPPVALRTEA